MITTRRTALAMLGLAPASAVGAETFNAGHPEISGGVQYGGDAYNKERYARAFEQLASEIRSARVDVVSIELRAKLEANSFVDEHDLNVRFRYKPEVV